MSSPPPYCRTNQTSSDVGMIGMITARRTGDAMEPGENSSMISRARACGRTRKGGRDQVVAVRAATDLARFWMAQGRCAEALDMLGPMYACFKEGFDTRDLKDARALLAELRC